MSIKNSLIAAGLFFLLSMPIFASETFIKGVKVTKNSANNYSFSVTLKHADKSWDHYANVWQVETLDGQVLGKRVLQHPHVNEQPFTRSLGSVTIDKGIKQVVITAGCNVDGMNSKKYSVKLK
ncbi:MAG: hypothetical protein ACI9ES_001173 [Oceanospirillaceae bacterium]|jgi:hypothetical protein